jgi:hypothetical protein
MKSLEFRGYALGFCTVVAMLAGCGGSQSTVPMGTTTRGAAAMVPPAGAWMDPSAPRIKRLLYVESDTSPFDVYVYNYASGKQVGKLTGFTDTFGMCVDAPGDVWITDLLAGTVTEFAHGLKTPLQTIRVGDNLQPTGCSISPINGDLAVATLGTPFGSVEVFKHAEGKVRHSYQSDVCVGPQALGYDNKGNLYIEGLGGGSQVLLCELPFKSGKLQVDSFDQSINSADGVMWDGKYVTLADGLSGSVNLYQVKSSHKGVVKTVGTTTLVDQNCSSLLVLGPFAVGQKNTPLNDVQATTVVGVNGYCNPVHVDYWVYPAGGNPQKTLPFGPANPGYQAVSIAP